MMKSRPPPPSTVDDHIEEDDSQKPNLERECCMCGDYGLAEELFQCRICLHRSQHKYCSDLYPKMEKYRTCNWCLRDKEERLIRSSSASSFCLNDNGNGVGLKRPSPPLLGSSGQLQRGAPANSQAVKKQKPVDEAKRERGCIGRKEEEMTKSEDLVNAAAKAGLSRQLSRGKVRRYKLLEEVSS
ncbi:uncharacterized protein LOC18431046 isoform X2 [Amborella trichopoda]|uniref:PHD-type zinc finger plants domain-containing protein n=1 Tax=Amborella trichopoda TaxID=13333 RepID=W1NZ78_AMBTC|nr:uncharacterized protein LOC18431046 isoform X2 [Amborella trichopoda]ERN02917.1 hypothetical protein AMTR_s00135p00076860 [Amborella trichopoda]|eukprot:XP_006841242.1 uncharacterized protein LOC18431046 isoform X2 [Amborella trichopoda]